MDRSLIDGRPVFVSKNEDKSLDFGQNKLKYATNLEKNKLFISGLPFSMDKSGLEEIMAKFGKVKEVRIVTYKNGKSKGLAYAEFEDEQSASKALLQTDGMLIGENQIAVAISKLYLDLSLLCKFLIDKFLINSRQSTEKKRFE